MDDKAFSELKLRATIVPSQSSWPKPEVIHWARLHEAADKARELAELAFSGLDAIDANPDLSPQGKGRQRAKVGAEAILSFQNSQVLERAQKAVAQQMEAWDQKVGTILKPPGDAREALLFWEIRNRFASLKDRERLSFLERFAGDTQIASALLTGPAGLTTLSEAEAAMLRSKVESHTPQEIRNARTATAKALQELEHGWKSAQAIIVERAGLNKDLSSADLSASAYKQAAQNYT